MARLVWSIGFGVASMAMFVALIGDLLSMWELPNISNGWQWYFAALVLSNACDVTFYRHLFKKHGMFEL